MTLERTSRVPKGVLNEPAKRAAPADVDIYDDFEGALSVEPASRPAHRLSQNTSREGTASMTDELQEPTTTPKQRKRQITEKAQTAQRSAVKITVNGVSRDKNVEGDIQDELAEETATPSRRKKITRTPATSGRKASAPKSASRKRLASPVVSEDGSEPRLPSRTITPSKPRSTRKPPASSGKTKEIEEDEIVVGKPLKGRTRKPIELATEISETEDELIPKRPTSTKKKTPSVKRRANRTDHDNNEGDHIAILAETPGVHVDLDDVMDVDGNSVMESVLDPTEPSPFNKPISAQKQELAQAVIYGNLPEGKELDLLKTIVLQRITGQRPSPLVGLDEEYRSVHQITEHTVTAGEGNSMLLIGARGSGKTALVNKVLSEVAKDNGGEFHVVRLNGFIHTDDKIALREIWRQLGKEMDIEEDGSGPGKNYADTLTTLLALLSHPSEQTGELTDQVAKAVIFIMDEFDLFAHHPRQTLLYNLFDIAQSRKAPILVLGLTTRIDVTNSLEKRVKSRFSHRYVHLSLAKTFTAFQETCKSCLSIQLEHISVEERGILEGGVKSSSTKKGKKDTSQSILADWNANIDVSEHLSINSSIANDP